MAYVDRTMIVPAALRDQCAQLTQTLAGQAGAGMFTTGLSATGSEPATHFVSAGAIEATFAAVLADPAMMKAACDQAGVAVSLAQCQAILGACDVSEEPPFSAFARLGLRMVA